MFLVFVFHILVALKDIKKRESRHNNTQLIMILEKQVIQFPRIYR
jgi:hypothetical protein